MAQNFSISTIVKKALKEDKASDDITTKLLISPKQRAEGYIKFNESGIVCGLQFAKTAFKMLDKNIVFRTSYKDGDKVKKNAKIIFIKGNARALLSAERVALNFLGYLSGIASKTDEFVKKVHPSKVKILDTRKTTPTLRSLEKYAVRCGGGTNHRDNLSEMTLIKDNHKMLHQQNYTLDKIIKKIRKATKKPIEIEVDNLQEFKVALATNPDFILLDNMKPSQMKRAVQINKNNNAKRTKKKICLEASGGINLNNIKSAAQTGVDRISIGELTHSSKNIDVSMDIS